ncbi:LysE family translocator [Chitinimonas naiadis]
MSFELYLSFLLATLVLIFSPGPVNILAISLSLTTGWRSALPCIWGASLAVLLQLVLTGLCLGSALMLDGRALEVLRWLGAAYLVYLGWQQWRASQPAADAEEDTDSARLFWRGFATSGLNPKTLLFFPSFFPQFIRTDASWSGSWQYLLLAGSFLLLFFTGVALNALFSEQFRALLHRPRRWRLFNRLMASLLLGMGAMLAVLR